MPPISNVDDEESPVVPELASAVRRPGSSSVGGALATAGDGTGRFGGRAARTTGAAGFVFPAANAGFGFATAGAGADLPPR